MIYFKCNLPKKHDNEKELVVQKQKNGDRGVPGIGRDMQIDTNHLHTTSFHLD